MKKKSLGELAAKLCQNLPFDWTFFEEDGFCNSPCENCKYQKSRHGDRYLCNKKTYNSQGLIAI